MIVVAGMLLGIVPFALSDTVNGAIIAGVFSVVNTVLNIRLIRAAKQTQEAVVGTSEQIASVKETAREANEEMIAHRTQQEQKHGTP